jgi:putative tryptophan/tyrosine transport system substrate-binding protein
MRRRDFIAGVGAAITGSIQTTQPLPPVALVGYLYAGPTDVRGAAIPIGREIEAFHAGNVGEIDAAFASLVGKRSEVLLVSPSSFFSGNRMQIVALAARHRVPALYFERDYAEVGGLMSYGANNPEQYRQLGIYAGRILNGKKPGDLPVVRATRFEFVINRKSRQGARPHHPKTLLAIADEVIE